MKIAFDVDDTLIIPGVCVNLPYDNDIPNYNNIKIYNWFKEQGHYMIIWSGGGKDYAEMWGNKLGLKADEYRDKGMGSKDLTIDISFDDCIVDLAKVNIRVKIIKNSINRKEWNKHK